MHCSPIHSDLRLIVEPLRHDGDGVFRVNVLNRWCDTCGCQGLHRAASPLVSYIYIVHIKYQDVHRLGKTARSPAMKVDVMRVQVVADVARLASPLLEGDELLLGLTHVRVEVAELAQLLLDALFGIGVHGIIALVHFNGAQYVVLDGELALVNSVSD